MELENLLCPELQPLLTLQIPEAWEWIPVHDGHIVYGLSFYYKGKRRDAVDISYWSDSQTYQTWVYGTTDKRYPTLEEAIEKAQFLMSLIERDVHYSDIASIRSEEYKMSLLDRVGIGKGIIIQLADAFSTLQELQDASIAELETVPGIGSDRAWLIASHLNLDIRYHELWDPAREDWVDLYQVPKDVLEQCVRTRTYMTQKIRNKYRITCKEIKNRGLMKRRQ